jgi:aminopeptidase YwaD
MKNAFWLLIISFQFAGAQKLKKADKVVLGGLETHISFLADDKLEGRRTGTQGEKFAYEYISRQFENIGLVAKGDGGSYLQQFAINDGKEISPVSHLIINGNDLKVNEEYFPFSFSPDQSLEATGSIALHENSNPWFYDIRELTEANKNNPHFDLIAEIKTKAIESAKKGANAFIVFNTGSEKDHLMFEPTSKSDKLSIPVLYISKTAKEKYLKDETATLDIKLKVVIGEKIRYGHNVIGYIDNNAATTIILGAHYDHLGYGEDKNSLYTGATPQIHNGADDNASGTGALIELGKMLKQGNYKNNNYLLAAFSGEELGLYGSKYYTEHTTIDLKNVNYMINMDMIGRLKDSTRGLSIGGYGTSPQWSELLAKPDKYFKISFDSSGTGPSDHTSFYRKDIPVLFFFTGTHADYHKPSDDADKINYLGELHVVKMIYSLIEKANKKGKLVFTKTRELPTSSKSSFRVSLGIMPDYTYSGKGVRADGVSEGKVAQKVGVKAGDILTQLGDFEITDMQNYMQTLNKFNKGDATKIKVMRGPKELVFDIVF